MAISSDAAQRLTARVTLALEQHGAFSLAIGEDELLSYLALNTQGSTLVVTAIQLAPQRASIWADLDAALPLLSRRRHALQVDLDLTCQQGHLQVGILRAFLDEQPLPRLLLASLEAMANAALADTDLTLNLEQVQIVGGVLLLRGNRP
jgi:hypothetical protein